MKTDIDELERLAKAATPGPWDGVISSGSVRTLRGGDDDYICDMLGPNGDANQAFISTCDPSTVLALLEELRLARAVVGAARVAMPTTHTASCLFEGDGCICDAENSPPAFRDALAAYDAHVKGGEK